MFIEEHYWYNSIDEYLNKKQKNLLRKMTGVVELTCDEYYEIVCVIYEILRRVDFVIFGC